MDEKHPWNQEYEIRHRKPAVGAKGEIILCYLPTNIFTPYATWRFYEDDLTQKPRRVDGAFFMELAPAMENFKNRSR